MATLQVRVKHSISRALQARFDEEHVLQTAGAWFCRRQAAGALRLEDRQDL
ncbi:MAG: hypothetical protein K1X74_14215 [Pirellulales bacterium]|nr:hypothetical protein [Pirellulales bacterium]